jgi:hypothetical protein
MSYTKRHLKRVASLPCVLCSSLGLGQSGVAPFRWTVSRLGLKRFLALWLRTWPRVIGVEHTFSQS